MNTNDVPSEANHILKGDSAPEVLPKLFRVWSVESNYHGYKDVRFEWFVNKREQPAAPYRDLITDYEALKDNDHKSYVEGFVDEMFTENEIAALRDYLKRNHDVDIEVEEVSLPTTGSAPWGALGAGGGTDYVMLDREPEYNLPFNVWAYFDLRLYSEATAPAVAEAIIFSEEAFEPMAPENLDRCKDFLNWAAGLPEPERWRVCRLLRYFGDGSASL